MSYILNALRKSERERQSFEPETVTARIVAHQPPRHQNSSWLIAALIVINLTILVYFLGFNDKTAHDKTSPAATQPTAADVKPLEAARPDIKSSSHRVIRAPGPSAIAAIVEARSAAPVTPPPGKPVLAQKQPLEPVKPELEQPHPVIEQVASTPDADEIQPLEAVLAQPQSVVQQAVPTKITIEKSAPVQAKSDLPFLDELPVEYGRSLPDLPINVFSYSSAPAERFVMIDMVKYIPGQRIKDQLELKEIRADSIVVSYAGRTFRIKRP